MHPGEWIPYAGMAIGAGLILWTYFRRGSDLRRDLRKAMRRSGKRKK